MDRKKGEGHTLRVNLKTREDKPLKWTEKWGEHFREGPESGTGERLLKLASRQNVV